MTLRHRPSRPAATAAAPARRRPGLVAAIVVLATAFVGWVVWAALGAAAPAATGQVIGFRVTGPHSVRVSLVVGGDKGRLSCTVQALDRDPRGGRGHHREGPGRAVGHERGPAWSCGPGPRP